MLSRVPAALLVGAALALGACAEPRLPTDIPVGPRTRPTGDFAEIPFAAWDEREPAYRLYPGDVLDVLTPSAPELARTVTVQPDGRVSLPLLPPMMVADRTLPEAQAILSSGYATQLRDPTVEIGLKQATPLKIFVGGEVRTPGVYDMPGDINALQAVIMAGGFLPTARRQEAILIRRGEGGRPMMRTVDLRRAIYAPGAGGAVALRRFDILYVPKSSIGEIDQFIELYVRQTLPIQFSYAVSPSSYVTAP